MPQRRVGEARDLHDLAAVQERLRHLDPDPIESPFGDEDPSAPARIAGPEALGQIGDTLLWMAEQILARGLLADLARAGPISEHRPPDEDGRETHDERESKRGHEEARD